MKIYKLLGLLLCTALLFSACTPSADSMSPGDVAKAFLEEVAQADFEGAEAYATKDSKQLLKSMASMASLGGDAPKNDVDIEIVEVKEDGDKATVTYKDSSEDNTQDIKLKKEDGAWKVIFSKGGLMDDAMDEGLDLDMDLDDEESELDTEEFRDAMNELDAVLDSTINELEDEREGEE